GAADSGADVRRNARSVDRAAEDQGSAEASRTVGRRPGESVSHHVEERAEGRRRALQQRQLDRISVGADGNARANGGPRPRVVSDRRAQGGGSLRLLGAQAGFGAVRSDNAKGRLAFDGKLLPWWRVRLCAVGLPGRRHLAGGNEPRAIRMA